MKILEMFNEDLLFWQIIVIAFGSIFIKNILPNNFNSIGMNQKSTKFLSAISNLFLFLLVSIIIFLLILLTLSETIMQISIEELEEKRQMIYGSLTILFMYSIFFATLISPIWLKKRKYYLLELANKEGEIMHFKLLKRLNYNGVDNLIYEDDDGKMYEKTVENIKNKEGRLTFIPKYKWLLDINTDHFKEFEVLPIIWRRIIYSVVFLLSIYILWQSILSIITLWSINVDISLIEFKLLMTCPLLLFALYTILGGHKLYSLWFGKSKIPYKKEKNNIS
ncbi:hypothetical protein [Mammaliicoccus lentus]|uniref:hypothetical protein n=1 Tax=Mammaliicoccus lentus TaxID=42858 RepID=UPI001071A1B3|nr:hypothetical protein [Mammaliicoccus lentus]MBF0795729.1 hypothetical protein [Mammaliicoccus lentus]TFV13692.1 hypothetical protein E4T78_13975 [Mammaliicoccus lentus]